MKRYCAKNASDSRLSLLRLWTSKGSGLRGLLTDFQEATGIGRYAGPKQGIVRARALPKPSAPVKRLATKQEGQLAKVDRTGPPSAKKSRSSEEVDKKNVTSVQKPIAEEKVVKAPASQAQAPRAPGAGAGAGARAERAPEVHCELNPLMSRMLNAELQDIMIRVWQQLPDKPPTEAEGLVVDKLRNEIGDDLRNVIGLDVTKRLLNIHNPLLVKIKFSTRPDIASLKKFLKYYNITDFKVTDKTSNTFTAQLRSIKDFDSLCEQTKLRCGGAQVTVASCYNFTKCPVKIKTNFVDKTETEESKTETMADSEQNVKKEEKAIKTPIQKEINEKTVITSKPVVKNEKVDLKSNIPQGKSDNVDVTVVSKPNKNDEYDDKVKPTDSKTKSPVDKEPEKKECEPKVNAVNNKIDSPVKVEAKPTTAADKGINVKIETKPVEKSMGNIQKTADVKLNIKTAAAGSAEKSVDAKSNATTVASSAQKSVSTKPIANNATSSAEKSVDAKPNVKTVASSAKKSVSTKSIANNATSSAEKSVDSKPNVKTISSSTQKSVSGKASTSNAASNVQKTLEAKSNIKNVSIPQKSVDVKCKTKNVPIKALKQSKSSDKKNLDEYEEMNDEEILQLLSGGIVLDECGAED